MILLDRINKFLKSWAMAVAMVVGIASYLIYRELPLSVETKVSIRAFIDFLIPTMVFAMLYVTFCKVNLRDVKFTRWHLVLSVFQIAFMVVLAVILHFVTDEVTQVLLQAAFICLASPTATGSVVVLTTRFGGNSETTTAYTIISNLITAFCVPVLLPLMSPQETDIFGTFLLILKRVTPLLVIPLFFAYLTQRFKPAVSTFLSSFRNLPMYLWAVAMCLALAMTMRFILTSNFPVSVEVAIAFVSMFVCFILFFCGKKLGGMYGEKIGAGQGLAQRNTVFIIWLGSNFLSPISSIAGGFYSIWQNSFNSYQMYKFSKNGKL